jgi:hypothetical protein
MILLSTTKAMILQISNFTWQMIISRPLPRPSHTAFHIADNHISSPPSSLVQCICHGIKQIIIYCQMPRPSPRPSPRPAAGRVHAMIVTISVHQIIISCSSYMHRITIHQIIISHRKTSQRQRLPVYTTPLSHTKYSTEKPTKGSLFPLHHCPTPNILQKNQQKAPCFHYTTVPRQIFYRKTSKRLPVSTTPLSHAKYSTEKPTKGSLFPLHHCPTPNILQKNQQKGPCFHYTTVPRHISYRTS